MSRKGWILRRTFIAVTKKSLSTIDFLDNRVRYSKHQGHLTKAQLTEMAEKVK